MNKTILSLLSCIIEVISLLNESNILNEGFHGIRNPDAVKEKLDEINKLYGSLTEQEMADFYAILEQEFVEDKVMLIYLLSVLLYSMHHDEILEKIVDAIISSNLDIYLSVLLEFQIGYEIFTNNVHGDKYQLRRSLHAYNLKKFNEAAEIPQNYISYENRNRNRIVIIADQILSLNHAPTKVILEQCYTLSKDLGMEVFLITSPIRGNYTDEAIWFNLITENHNSYLDGNHIVTYLNEEVLFREQDLNNEFIIVYNDHPIRGKQMSFIKDNENSIEIILKQIYEFNPIFVYDMGSIHPLANACNKFTTVVSMIMGYGLPVSEAPILLSFNKNGGQKEEKIGSYVLNSFNQVVIKDTFIFTIDNALNPHSRITYGLTENYFILALVGNRLKEELANEFINMLKQVMYNDKEIAILIIGEYEEYELFFNDIVFRDRIHYIGYQKDLADVISIADIYLNPPRKGGGTSALISLYSGVPVITLPEGDVPGNVGTDFICKDFDEMLHTIAKYKQDKEFYNNQREKGISYTHKSTDLASNMKNKINKIEEKILLMEGKTTGEY